MKEAHEVELAALKASMTKASNEELEKLKAKHAKEIMELGKTHEKLIAQINADFDKQLSQKEQDHSDTVQ